MNSKNHIIKNSHISYLGCPDPAIGGMPNPMNLSCCEYEILTESDFEQGGKAEMCYDYYNDPEGLEERFSTYYGNDDCNHEFTCAEAHSLLGLEKLTNVDPSFEKTPLEDAPAQQIREQDDEAEPATQAAAEEPTQPAVDEPALGQTLTAIEP